MESETQKSADVYENSVDEVGGEMQLAEENPAEDESEAVEELQVSENAKLSFPNYSYKEPEFSNEVVAAQPFAEEDFSEADKDYSDKTEETEVSMTDEDSEEAAVSMADKDSPEYSDEDSAEYIEIEDEIFTSNAVAENDYAPEFEEAEQYSSAENYAATEETVFEQTEVEESNEEPDYNFQAEQYGEEHSDKPPVEMLACPFCNAENESNAFVCNSCRAMLSLSNLEMLLAHQEVDTERLSNAVERMEVEKNLHDFSSDELKFLAIGQINLKHLRQGFANLQAASHLNPNDVVLSSQVNVLAIRLSEIEQQESLHSSMPKNRTILVVDDSATVRKLVSGKLEKCGHEVVCAIDGVDALEKINALVPDLILLDITMPRMDGYQVCKLIRNNEATKDVPIVMISGKDGFFDKVRGRMAGTTGYITKPFGPETLMKTVEAYIIST
jgi:twitching motility two-component system response regulator PilG